MRSIRRLGAWLLLLAAMAEPASAATQSLAEPTIRPPRITMQTHLTAEHRFSDLLCHPTLSHFAHLILPTTERDIDRSAKLSTFPSLLPYHQHVEIDEVLQGVNRLIDDASAGKKVVYDIYSNDEKRRDPSKSDTGLFFLRGQPGAPVAVIAPGGGFAYVGSVHEGFPYALEINRRGYNAFVLRYRVGLGQAAATADLAAAMAFIFQNAEALQVSTSGYSLWGSSAGARMVASLGTHGAVGPDNVALPRPAAIVMAYTGHSEYSASDPPTFVVVGGNDRIASPAVMERRLESLRRAGVPVEYRKYESLGHGFGTGSKTAAKGWIDAAMDFWERVGLKKVG